ncbi:hypothetical protein D3C78_1225220 [compost metagenome]
MRHCVRCHVIFTDPRLDFSRQIRCRSARQSAGQIVPRQRLQRARYRLRGPLHIAAGAVFLHLGLIFRRFTQRFRIQPRMLVLCLLQAIDITLGADNIHRLPGDFADQLRLLQPVLLFLLVEDRPDTAIGVIRIPAQRIHILLLVGPIANNHATARHRSLGRAFCMPFRTAI